MSQTGYTPIQLYRSTTASTAPTAGNLAAGELAINTTDGKLYYKDTGGVVQTIASKAGASGDVVGPASATDNAIVRFDGTTGKLIQNSFVTIADDGTTIISVNSSTDALRITQTGAGNALLVEDDTNPDSSPFVINASGSVGMGGTTVPAGTNFYNIKTLTGSTNPYSNRTVATVQTDATGTARGYVTSIGVVAAHPTLSGLQHFLATQASFNASTVTNQIGYYANTSLVGAATNYAFSADDLSATTGTAYGFYSNSNISGTGTAYNFYAAGTAPNVFVGTVNIGALPVAGTNFYNAKTITGATTATANNTFGIIQSDVTAQARGYTTNLGTAASAFTLAALRHFYAFQGTIGAGSTVTYQIGYYSENNLIGATLNYGFAAGDTAAVTAGKTTYGFHSSVNTASGGGTTYAFYAAGTAPSVFTGTVNIGSNGLAGANFYNAKSITGATTAYANHTLSTVQSDVTGSARAYSTFIGTAAASFTLGNLQHFLAQQGTIGAGSTVTSQTGFSSAANLIDATSNIGFFANDTAAVTATKTAYGFYSAVNAPTGGGTTYAFYAQGTADNVFRGNTYHGNTGVTPTAKIHVAAGSATANTAPLKFTAGTNLTTAEAGAMEYDGENLYFSGEASQRGVVAASQFVILTSDYTTPLGTANVLKQAFNATTNGALTLTLGSYLFECLLNLSSLSATSGTIAFGFGGTALGRFRYLANANKAATSTTAANTTFSSTAAATIITPATTTTTGYALVQGSIVITTAGTIIPSIALSIAAANVVATGSYFSLTPIGSSTVQTVGNWS